MKTKISIDFQLRWQGQLSDYVTAIAHSPDGKLWAAASGGGEVSLFSATTFEEIIHQGSTGQSVDCLAFSQDGNFLAIAGQNGQLQIWKINNGLPELMTTLEYPKIWIDRLVWNPSQNQLAYSLGKRVHVWDATSQKIVISRNFEASSVLALDWRRDGRYLAIAGYQGIQVWDALNWEAEPTVLEIPSASVAIAWSFDGKYLASGNLDSTLTLYEWGNPTPWLMQGFLGKVHQLAWCQVPSKGYPLLAVSSGEEIVIWQREQNDFVGWSSQTTGHSEKVTAIAFQSPKTLLASAGQDGRVHLWHRGKQLTQSLKGVSQGFSCLSWHPRGEQLIAGGENGEILIWSQTKRGQGFSRLP
jgi:WD40 repeat protein